MVVERLGTRGVLRSKSSIEPVLSLNRFNDLCYMCIDGSSDYPFFFNGGRIPPLPKRLGGSVMLFISGSLSLFRSGLFLLPVATLLLLLLS